MRKLFTVIATLTILCSPLDGIAQERNGVELLKGCQSVIALSEGDNSSDVVNNALYWAGYIGGAVDTNAIFKAAGTRWYCTPEEGLSAKQMTRIFITYLNEHPEELHREAFLLIYKALTIAYPCPDN